MAEATDPRLYAWSLGNTESVDEYALRLVFEYRTIDGPQYITKDVTVDAGDDMVPVVTAQKAIVKTYLEEDLEFTVLAETPLSTMPE